MTAATMYDDVNAGLLPAGTAIAGGYIDGNWPNAADIQKKFPSAKVIRIAVQASDHDGACLDVENGDATNEQAPGWFKAREGHTVTPRPWLYTSASNIAALVATMHAAGIARNRYFVWSAHYTGQPHICGPKTCGYPQADGTQWTDKARGENLDQSLINTYMLPGYKPPTVAAAPVAPKPAPTAPPSTAGTHPVITDARNDLTSALNNPANAKNATLLAKLRAALNALRGIK